jgi:hypothetical protein
MGYLVKDDGYRGGDSNGETNEIGCCDNCPIDKIVDSVSEQIHIPHRMYGMIGFQDMLMSPEKKLLKDEEQEYSSQDPERGFHFRMKFLK